MHRVMGRVKERAKNMRMVNLWISCPLYLTHRMEVKRCAFSTYSQSVLERERKRESKRVPMTKKKKRNMKPSENSHFSRRFSSYKHRHKPQRNINIDFDFHDNSEHLTVFLNASIILCVVCTKMHLSHTSIQMQSNTVQDS